MKRTATGHGVYVDESGGYWARLWVNKRRTWRRLKSKKLKEALAESLAVEPESSNSFAAASAKYIADKCPNKRLEDRGEYFCERETQRVGWLNKFFGKFKCEEIKIGLLPAYKKWRTPKIEKGTGERTIDLEINALSNVLNYQVALGKLDFNFIRSGRPRFRKDSDIRRARDMAPESAEQIHAIALGLFKRSIRSEVFGWMTLFAAYTGCRTSELLRLRRDAKNENEPGFISGNYLFLGRRSKFGVNPWSLLFPEFAEMVAAFIKWHDERFPNSPWYFPGLSTGTVVESTGHVKALRTICEDLKITRITPHGLRSFYVTKRRSDGIGEAQIAAEIGDKTVALLATTYGGRPQNWGGGEVLLWVPKDKKPAWEWTKTGLKPLLSKTKKRRGIPANIGGPTRI